MPEDILDARLQLATVRANQEALSQLMAAALSPAIVAALKSEGEAPALDAAGAASAVSDASAALRSLDARLPGLRAAI